MINIKKLRELRGTLKQGNVAAAIGISQNYYSQIENGTKHPSLEIAIRIANYYKIALDVILNSNPTLAPAGSEVLQGEKTA